MGEGAEYPEEVSFLSTEVDEGGFLHCGRNDMQPGSRCSGSFFLLLLGWKLDIEFSGICNVESV